MLHNVEYNRSKAHSTNTDRSTNAACALLSVIHCWQQLIFIEMAKMNLTYKKRKLEIDYNQSKNGKVSINQIKMIETGKDITNYVDSNNKQRISNMIKVGEAEWI